MEPSAGLRTLDLSSLVGRSLDEARAVVETAGGRVRVVGPGDPVTADYRADRVTLIVENGVVTEIAGIG